MSQNDGFTVPEGDEVNLPNSVIPEPDITIAPKPNRSKKSIENEAVTKENLAQQNKTNKRLKLMFLKNVFLVGGSWILLFTAFQSIANLQSSLNSDSGLGTASLSTIYVTLILGSIFLPTTMMEKLGIKWTIVICQFTYILYIAANFYAKYWTMIPAAIILGRKQAIFLN
jgi:hypothetical protein